MSKTLRELAKYADGEARGDPDAVIHRAWPIGEAGGGDITFISNPLYRSQLNKTQATAVIVAPNLAAAANSNLTSPGRGLLISGNPYLAFAKVLEILYTQPDYGGRGMSPRAEIHPSARLGKDVCIHAAAHIGAETSIGDRSVIMPGVFVGDGCVIGADCALHPNVVIYHGTRIGDRVIIQANSTVGSDGFGFAPDGKGYRKIPQVGITVIEDDVNIGANSTVNRAAMGATIIRRGCKIDSQVVISHNVDLGAHSLLVSQVGIAGTTRIGKRAVIAGKAGIAGHLTIGDNVTIGALSGVTRDLPADRTYLGMPARPISETRQIMAAMRMLPELRRRVRELELEIESLRAT